MNKWMGGWIDATLLLLDSLSEHVIHSVCSKNVNGLKSKDDNRT